MTQARKGVFISLEGLDCSGKSTVGRMLKERFPEVVFTREPGGTPVAENIRHLILTNAAEMDPKTESLLFYAARIEHVNKLILPALNNGINVITDRYYDSTLAYQGALAEGFVFNLNEFMLNNGVIRPDYTILLDISVETYVQRKQQRGVVKGEEINGIEDRDLETYSRMSNIFKANAAKEPERFIVIDANQSLEQVCRDVLGSVRALFGAQ